MTEFDLTCQEVAARLRCHPRTVARIASRYGIGVNLGGRAGWRFTEAEYQQLRSARKPKRTPRTRRVA